MEPICPACNASVKGSGDDAICLSKRKLGRHCFTCRYKDHVEPGHESLFTTGSGIVGFQCPNCGERNVYMGGDNYSGTVVGSVRLQWT